MTTAVTAKEEVLIVSPSDIAIGPFQPRTVFPKDAHADMVASVKQRGVLTPLLVRPHPVADAKGVPKYELVTGERRWRAAKEVGCRVPVICKPLTDDQVREIQLIENLQREGLSPMDEACGYEKLQRDQKLTVQEIAAKVGKSESYVYQRLKLCALGKEARKALNDGKITVAIGVAIAGVLDPKGQATLVKYATTMDFGSPRTLSQVRTYIRSNFMLRLKDAPFNLSDEKLVPEAGSCDACPKSTSNDRTLFGHIDASDALCTDGTCYATKVDATWILQQKSAEAEGSTILDDKTCKKLYPYGTSALDYSGPYIDMEHQCEIDPQRRTFHELLKKVSDAEHKPSLARDPRGQGHWVMHKTDALAALKAAGHAFAKKARVEEDDGNRDAQNARATASRTMRKNNIGKRTALLALAEVSELSGKRRGEHVSSADFWRVLCSMAIRSARGTAHQLIARRREIKPIKHKYSTSYGDALRKVLEEMTAVKDIIGLTVELLCVDYDAYNLHSGGFSKSLQEACAFYKINLKQMERTVAANWGKRKKKTATKSPKQK